MLTITLLPDLGARDGRVRPVLFGRAAHLCQNCLRLRVRTYGWPNWPGPPMLSLPTNVGIWLSMSSTYFITSRIAGRKHARSFHSPLENERCAGSALSPFPQRLSDNFSDRGHWQFRDKFNMPGIFVRSQPAFHEILDLAGQRHAGSVFRA